MTKRNYIYIALVVVVLALLYAGGMAWSKQNAKKLSVVYLSSNEIYVGHLYTFPKLVLTDAYILQSSAGENPGQEFFPLAAKPWAPVRLYLNRDQVLYFGPVKDDSEAARGIQEKQK